MSEKIKSCDKHKRGCNEEECKPGECENYKYNHKRYNRFSKNIGLPMGQEELVNVIDDLVDAQDMIDQADGVLRTAKSEHKAVVDVQDEIKSNCILTMRSKQKSVSKDLEECYNYVDKTYTLTYQDDDDKTVVVDKRPLTDVECQDEMDVVIKHAEGEQKEAGEDDEPAMTPKKAKAVQVPEELIEQAIALIKEKKNCKIAMIQRGLNVKPLESGAILDQLEERGFIGPLVEGKEREILMDTEPAEEK